MGENNDDQENNADNNTTEAIIEAKPEDLKSEAGSSKEPEEPEKTSEKGKIL